MKKMIITLMTMSLIFVSCDSETSNQEDSALKSSTTAISSDLKALRDEALKDINQGGTIYYDSKEGAQFTTASKTSIVIPPGSIQTRDGKDFDGNIDIDYIEIFERHKMVVTNKPTMARSSNGIDKELLVTGGEFYLDIKNKDESVNIVKPIKINISTAESNADPVGMVLWNGDIDDKDDLTWDSADKDDLVFENDGEVFRGKGDGSMYDVLMQGSSNFGWCNIDRLVSWPGQKTPIGVIVPSGFDQSNASVYLAIEGEENMLAQFDTFDPSTNTFGEHYGLVPVGLDCHIIFVGEQGGNYVYSILSTTIGNNATYSIPTSSLITTSNYSQLENAIQALP